ncbi:MAG: hypothetical protein WDA28_13280 [Castellaniella sp.]
MNYGYDNNCDPNLSAGDRQQADVNLIAERLGQIDDSEFLAWVEENDYGETDDFSYPNFSAPGK